MKNKIILLIAISVFPFLSDGQTPYMFRDTNVAVFHGSVRLVNP
ncbi:MAG: hypothetical protein ACKVQV_11125 [Bacteroidia bacterium]